MSPEADSGGGVGGAARGWHLVMICLLKWMVTCEGHCILWAILKMAFPIKANCLVYCVSPDQNMYLSKMAWAIWKPFHQIIQLHSQTALALSVNMCLHSSLWHKGVLTFFAIIAPLCNIWITLHCDKDWFTLLLVTCLHFVVSLALLCNNAKLSHFVIKLSHFVVLAVVCNKDCSIF